MKEFKFALVMFWDGFIVIGTIAGGCFLAVWLQKNMPEVLQLLGALVMGAVAVGLGIVVCLAAGFVVSHYKKNPTGPGIGFGWLERFQR